MFFLCHPDEKQKRFINSPFFCSEFQSVSRIVKIVHSAHYAQLLTTNAKSMPDRIPVLKTKVIDFIYIFKN